MEPKRILVVDDTEISRETLTVMLADIFCQADVCQAEDGLVGWEMISRDISQFDLVITDYQMPRMNGLELTRKIRENFPETKVIIASGYDSQKLAEKALEAGANHFFQKPITLQAMQDIIPRL